MTIFEKNIANLAFVGLHSNIKEKIENFEFLSVNQFLQKVSTVESHSNCKESQKSHHHPNMHAIECHSDGSNNETNDCFFAKFVWLGQAKLVSQESARGDQIYI